MNQKYLLTPRNPMENSVSYFNRVKKTIRSFFPKSFYHIKNIRRYIEIGMKENLISTKHYTIFEDQAKQQRQVI